jgi:serine/threonine-protein kinase
MSDVRNKPADPVPTTIGRYQITGSLGFGAMGAVYKAFDPLIRRPLAIKTVRVDIPRSSPQYRSFLDRFQHEAQISGTLSHPGIVTLFDLGEDRGDPFFAMEFVDGRTIADILAEGERFKPERVIGLVSQVAAALDYAHSRGVIHRDIKPANLILYDGDKVKITDFGIAKLADADITHAGALLGTPSYMSPEQAMGEKLDGRSDIFSLGVVAFEMLSGQQPFPGPNVTSILYKLVHVDPVEPADLEMNGLVPHKWREVFHKVLAKKPERRYQTASAFVQDLEYCLGSWWSGLGSEETLRLAPAGDVPTVEAPPPPLPAPAALPRGGAGTAAAPEAEIETVLIPGQGGAVAEGATTLVLDATSPGGGELSPPPTLIAAAEATERLPPVAPPGAPETQPSGPTVPALPQAPVAGPTPAAPRAPRPGIPLPMVLGGAAAGLAVVLLAAWALRSRTPAAAPGAPPSEPAAAVPAPTAEPAASPRAGTPPVQGESSGARARRRAAAATTGTADFVSTPAGASVSVDGKPVGVTPLRGQALAPGRRRVEVALEGHATWRSTIEVTAGETGRVDVRLSPLPKATPTPEPVDVTRVYPNEPGAVDTPARRVSGSSPSYPVGRAPRLRTGQRVSVLVRLVVSASGEPTDVVVVESAGKAVDDVVVAAVRGWRFEPAVKGGVRVRVETSFRQTFLGG